MTLNNLTLDQCDDLMLTLITNQGKVAARKVYYFYALRLTQLSCITPLHDAYTYILTIIHTYIHTYDNHCCIQKD